MARRSCIVPLAALVLGGLFGSPAEAERSAALPASLLRDESVLPSLGHAPLAPGLDPYCVEIVRISDRCPTYAATYDNPRGHGQYGGYDRLAGMRLSPDGARIYAYGFSDDDTTGADLAVVAFEAASGTLLWTYHFDSEQGAEAALGLAVSPAGDTVYVGGTDGYGSGEEQLVATALDADTGVRRWVTHYGERDLGVHVLGPVISSDGSRLYFGGSTWVDGAPDAGIGIAVDAASGTVDWVEPYELPVLVNLIQIAGGSDGTFYLTGYARPRGNFYQRDYLTVAFRDDRVNRRGDVAWADRARLSDGINVAYAVAVSPDASKVAVTGQSYRGAGNTVSDYGTVAYDSAGKRLWIGRWGGATNGNNAVGYGVAFSPDGSRVFATGQAPNLDPRDVVPGTVAYATTSGEQLWTSLPQSAGYYSLAHAVTSSVDGSTVYVTGEMGSGNVRGAETLALSAQDGTVSWRSLYNAGPVIDWDLPVTIIASPDGSRLYVGAQAQHKTVPAQNQTTVGVNTVDFLVLAYDLP